MWIVKGVYGHTPMQRVWVDEGTCVEVDMVTYSPDCYDGDSPDCYDGDKLYLVDIECHDITEDVLAECADDEEEDW